MIQRRKYLKRKTPLRRSGIKKKKVNTGDYYSYHIEHSTGYCENCKGFIPMYEEWRKYAAQCHILDKDIFPEVAAEHDNHFEGCLSCHDNFDAHNDRIIEDKFKDFLPVIKERLDKFIANVLPENLYKVPKYLRTEKWEALYSLVDFFEINED